MGGEIVIRCLRDLPKGRVLPGVPQLLSLGVGLKLVGRRAAGFLEPAARAQCFQA
jgi:hypothetical protein